MSSTTPRYVHEESPVALQNRYSHRFHAGNVGDIWKHVVLVALLQELTSSARPCAYFETHAGNGLYALGGTGEWVEGAGAFFKDGAPLSSPLLMEYQNLVLGAGFHPAGKCSYPGSPVLAARVLRPKDSLTLWEIEGEAHAELSRVFAHDIAASSVHLGDGLAALGALPANVGDKHDLFVHLDPPWNEKQDWQQIPQLVAKTVARMPGIQIALWYPIKSYTRVAAMTKFLESQNLTFSVCELLTTPLDQKKNRLNGSGMLLIGAPSRALAAIAAAGAEIGVRCGRNGFWDLRLSHCGVPAQDPVGR